MIEKFILPDISAAERLGDCTGGRVREVKFVIRYTASDLKSDRDRARLERKGHRRVRWTQR